MPSLCSARRALGEPLRTRLPTISTRENPLRQTGVFVFATARRRFHRTFRSLYPHNMILASTARSLTAAPGIGRRAASGIASKYSKALYGAALAKSPQTLNQVHSELASVSSTLSKDPETATFVKNPTLSLQERSKGLQAIFAKLEGAGSKKAPLSEITKNFFSVLSQNGRLNETEGVIEGFNELVAQYKGEVTVTVTSASPLPKDILSRLETTLKQSETAKAAKVLTVTNKVHGQHFY